MTHPLASAAYAAVFERNACPLWVPHWGTHVLVRTIPNSQERDAICVYPLAVFDADADLVAGRRWLAEQGLVSVALTVDPLTAPRPDLLAATFDLCVPFKDHYVIDRAAEVTLGKHHRYEVKKALARVSVDEAPLKTLLDQWVDLYAALSERRSVGGLARLGRAEFERLAGVKGLRTLVATVEGKIVSMHLWLEDLQTATVQSLLAASSAEGYAVSAAYGVHAQAIALFSGADRINLGGGAGLIAGEDGLTRFKRGFANSVLPAWFCGAVLNPERYAALSGASMAPTIPFPAYRWAGLAGSADIA